MLYNTLHNRWLRIVAAVVGELIAAAALNLFIVPLNLYTGGAMGVCQLIRTLLQTYLGLNFGSYDIAGILYFLVNIPILLYGYKYLGQGLVIKTIICTVAFSINREFLFRMSFSMLDLTLSMSAFRFFSARSFSFFAILRSTFDIFSSR